MICKYILMIIAAACMLQAASATPEMNIEPSNQYVANGSTFTVDIKVYPLDDEITTAMYYLHFDNTLLNAVSQTPGIFLRQGGEETKVSKNEIDNDAGTVLYAEYIKAIPDEGTFGVFFPGVLASVTFEVIGDNVTDNLNLTHPKMAVVDRSTGEAFVTYTFADVGNATFTISPYPKGDLNHNWVAADAGDVTLMLRASVGDVTTNPEYDLNSNGAEADAGDVTLMLRASVGDITL